MKESDIVVPLIAALWASTTLVFSCTREINAIRDKVISSKDGSGHPLTAVQRLHILNNDWMPFAICMFLMCLGFSIISICALHLVEERHRPTEIICYFVGGYAFLLAAALGYSCWNDRKAMVAAIKIGSS